MENKLEFIYVSDVAEIFEKSAFSNKKNEIYNVGTGKPQSILYLTKLLKEKKYIFLKDQENQIF